MYTRTKDGIYEDGREGIKSSEDLFDLVDEWFWHESFIFFHTDNIRFTYLHDDYIFILDDSILKDGVYGAIWTKDENGVPQLKTVCQMIGINKVKLV